MTVNHTYKTYKHNAKKRGYSFNLSKDTFERLMFEPCHYCGYEGFNVSKLVKEEFICYNGVDRVDNDTGYEIDNCVPCCGKCNIMKNNNSKEDFINHIKNILLNLKVER